MNEQELLRRRLEREMNARKEAEQISEKKLSELHQINCLLQEALAEQKTISAELTEKTRDLEIQKHITQAERTAKSLLQNILESSIEYSIVAISLEGTILVWNHGAYMNYGYKAEELVGKANMRLLHNPKDIESGAVQAFFDKAYREGEADSIFERVRKDGSHFIASVNMTLRHDENNMPVGYVIISRDVTKQKLLEDQLIKTNRELEQFAYVVSHDLKAPLRAIDNLATWIEEDNADKLTEKSKENLQLLRKRIIRMNNLIDGILQYSKAGEIDLEIQAININELLNEIVDSINPPPSFLIKSQPDLPTLYTSKTALSQVISNLITNAIKHHHQAVGNIEVNVKTSDYFYIFSVKDDGPGIEPEYHEKVFQLFQTLKTKDELESTGIGLSIVKKIVETQGGSIIVESAPETGTTISFSWPKHPKKKI